jgi:hypothetical protein
VGVAVAGAGEEGDEIVMSFELRVLSWEVGERMRGGE